MSPVVISYHVPEEKELDARINRTSFRQLLRGLWCPELELLQGVEYEILCRHCEWSTISQTSSEREGAVTCCIRGEGHKRKKDEAEPFFLNTSVFTEVVNPFHELDRCQAI
jgi:hypothetical protein